VALICRKCVISSSKRQHLHPVNAVEWTTVTNEWIVGKRSTLLLSQQGDWIAESITFLPREKDSKWGTHLRFFSPGHWRYSSCWAYKCCCCLKKHQAQAWALTISIAAVLYVANVLLYHANGRNAYVPYNPWWCLSGQEIIISYAMLQPQILQDSFLYCENNGSYVFYEAEEATANQTTRCEHRALFIVVPWKATFQGWNLHWWLV
jgi:hypothetical protein